uniref:CAAX prenyl protease n=2 Tax=Panagrolaimus sp. PS1159 TaxID=55785 RepID=A0AC35GVH7_9BILA
MEPSTIFWSLFTINWLIWLFEQYLAWRQYQVHLKNEKRPSLLSNLMTKRNYARARLYKLDRDRYGFVTDIFNQVQTTIFVFGGLMPLLWNYCGNYTTNEILQSIYFVLFLTVVDVVISFPFSYYDTFIIEQKHGFNQQTFGFFLKDKAKKIVLNLTFGFFLKDKAKKIVLNLVLTLPILSGIIWLVQWGGEYFFFYLWLFISAIIFVMMTIYPEFIAPLFDKYVPLPDGELKQKIEALAKKVGFPLTKLYVVQGSKRSSHSNAYMYGFWNNKRIVLYDTLLAPETIVELFGESEKKEEPTQENLPVIDVSDSDEEIDTNNAKNRTKKGMTDDEVVAVLGHELGHWKMHHTVIHIVIAELNLFLSLYIFGSLYKNDTLFEAFGFHGQHPTLIGFLLVFQLALAIYNEIAGVAQSFLSRHMEFSADRFSADLGYADTLSNSLIKLGVDNLSLPVDDPLYSAVHHSHPPIPERVKVLEKLKNERVEISETTDLGSE